MTEGQKLAALKQRDGMPEIIRSFDHPIFEDIVWRPANEQFGHTITVRKSPPDEFLSRYKNMRFSLGKIASQVDLIRQIFHGDTWKNPLHATGLSTFYSTIDREKAQNSVNVVDAEGSENLSSIYLVVWSERTVYLAYSVVDGDLLVGLIPEDWRYVVRIANIDTKAEYPIDLAATISQGLYRLPIVGSPARPEGSAFGTIYAGATVQRMIGAQGMTDKGFRTVPIRIVDALSAEEPRVT